MSTSSFRDGVHVPRPQAAHRTLKLIAATLLLPVAAGAFTLGGCATSEPVGRTKTVEKTTVDTPTEKKTITETREKETKYVPR